jgi:hypothetical protein
MAGSWPAKLSGRRPLACAALLLSGFLGGCLPESGPGIGQRVLPGRGFANMSVGVGEQRSLFFTLPSQAGQNRGTAPGLYVLRPGQPAPELLADDVAGSPVSDARGRVYVQHTPALDPDVAQRGEQKGAQVYQLRQIDLASGASRELGEVVQLSRSPGATHLVLARPDGRVDSLNVDGELRSLPTTPSARMQFVGEDVCWIDKQRLDCALVEGGPPVHPTDRSVLKLLPLPSVDGRPDVLITTVDITTRPPAEFLQFWRVRLRPRPGEPGEVLLGRGRPLGEMVVSGDADWFAFVDLPASGVPQLRLVSAGAPAEAELTLESGPSDFDDERTSSDGWSDPRFRPGHNEIWSLGPRGKLAILRASGSPAVHRPPGDVRRAPYAMEWTSDRLDFYPAPDQPDRVKVRKLFSSDGRWWIYREGDWIHLGDANDPAAGSRLRFPVADAPGAADILGQHRLAIWSSVGGQRVQLRLYLADTLSLLGTVDEVRQAVVGARGMLALTGYQGSDWQVLEPGTLVLGALGAGRRPVVLGQNVSQFALLDGCLACDPIAAGTGLAYTVHARVPWKYDGLWVGELP